MGSGVKQLLRDEIISIYVGANVILGALVDLGVHLTVKQISALIIIGNVVLGPVVHHFTNTTPSTVAKAAAVEQVRGELAAVEQSQQVAAAIAAQPLDAVQVDVAPPV